MYLEVDRLWLNYKGRQSPNMELDQCHLENELESSLLHQSLCQGTVDIWYNDKRR
jgi:hypothetical protein